MTDKVNYRVALLKCFITKIYLFQLIPGFAGADFGLGFGPSVLYISAISSLNAIGK